MLDPNADAEYHVLTSDVGQALLAEIQASRSMSVAFVDRLRRHHSPPIVAAALRLAESRRKARGKYSLIDAMWLTPRGAEQATAEPVARHKAARLSRASATSVVDLCCGVGGDVIALGRAMIDVLAVDRDHGMARRSAWNAWAHGVASRVQAVRARAEEFAIPTGAFVHIDPDRRPGTHERARSLHGFSPGPEFLEGLMRSTRGGAIKLGPANDFHLLENGHGRQVEIVSLYGECKEATIWYGEALSGDAPRIATTLPSGESWEGNPGSPTRSAHRLTSTIGRWIADPDPALVRSGLVDNYAQKHGLVRVAAGVDFLTTDDMPSTPFLAAFEVEAILPLDRKILRRRLSGSSLGPFEIKTRGMNLAPEVVRSWIRDPGCSDPVTLLIFGGTHASAQVVIARRRGVQNQHIPPGPLRDGVLEPPGVTQDRVS